MDTQFTDEQDDVINAAGDTIVSASAGSGKTTVMIERLVQKIIQSAEDEDENDDDHVGLDNILAVTYTNAAADNMRDRLRSRLGDEITTRNGRIAEMEKEIAKLGEDEKEERDKEIEELKKKKAARDRLTDQYDLIPGADVSTMHSFCFNLIKKYFYFTDCDANSEILDGDSPETEILRGRVFDNLFNGEDGKGGYYGDDGCDECFSVLLEYLGNGKNDEGVKTSILSAYKKVTYLADYRGKLETWRDSYTEDGFKKVWEALKESDGAANAADGQPLAEAAGVEAGSSLEGVKTETSESAQARERETIFWQNETYDYVKELTGYLEAGKIARALCQCLLDYDKEYAKVKREEHRLDYSDLEQTALDLLCSREDVVKDLDKRYKLIFVDEYQDINPAQNDILSKLHGEKFFVGDVKQAIYSFRGGRSKYFSDKYEEFGREKGKNAMPLSINFRSADAVINAVNAVFDASMTKEVCDIDYSRDRHDMKGPERKPDEDDPLTAAGCGAQVLFFENGDDGELDVYPVKRGMETKKTGGKGKDKKSVKDTVYTVYSVKNSPKKLENLCGEKAVAKLIKKYLRPKEGKAYKENDICVLVRKNDEVQKMTKALEGEGIRVSGVKADNILKKPEVMQLLDILSYIDDGEQDLPMVSAMLSPIGDFTEDDLAAIRLYDRDADTYRGCVENYRTGHEGCEDSLYMKTEAFFETVDGLRKASKVLSAEDIVEKAMRLPGMELRYAQYPDSLKAIYKVAAYGRDKTISAFLKTVTAKDANIEMSSDDSSDSSDGVNVRTMHKAKGLEFKVVIIYDAAGNLGGGGNSSFLFDEEFGFAFKYYNPDDKTKSDTLLWKLADDRRRREDVKNELNVFYVACTRARERLDIMTSQMPSKYDAASAREGRKYTEFIDLLQIADLNDEIEKAGALRGGADGKAGEDGHDAKVSEDTAKGEDASYGHIAGDTAFCEDVATEEDKGAFKAEYRRALDAEYRFEYMNAPSKTSVTAAIRKEEKYKKFLDADAEADEKPDDDDEDEEGGAKRENGADKMEVGTAYHKFLELWDDPDVRDALGIEKMIDGFVESGQMTERQRDILRDDFHKDYSGPAAVAKVIYDKVYKGRTVEKAYHERRFLCNLPVEHVYEDKYRGKGVAAGSEDMVLVQGTIDLLVLYDGGKWQIFDYKYSTRSEKALYETYHRQLELYAEAAKKILGLNEETAIETELVNINPRI